MKQLTLIFSILILSTHSFAQQGYLTLTDMISISNSSVDHALEVLLKDKGFFLTELQIGEAMPPAKADSMAYLFWNSRDSAVINHVTYNSKIKGGSMTNLFSFSTTDSAWYSREISNLALLGFSETDATLRTDHAQDMRTFQKDDTSVKIYWSYLDTPVKNYVIDIVQFRAE